MQIPIAFFLLLGSALALAPDYGQTKTTDSGEVTNQINKTVPLAPGANVGRQEGTSKLRLPRLYAVLASIPRRRMGPTAEHTKGARPTVPENRCRLVSTPSTSRGERPTRRARAAHRGPLPIFRRERKRAESPTRAARVRSHLAQVVESEEPASAQDLGRFQRSPSVVAATEGQSFRPNLASSSMRRSRRRSRMVEISLSGSGEGPGKATTRAYSTSRK